MSKVSIPLNSNIIIAEKTQEVNTELQKIEMKKKNALKIQEELTKLYVERKKYSKAENIKECGTFLMFRNYHDADNTKELKKANFCKHSLCPMCAWRLHLKNTKIMSYALEHAKGRLYHLVLAIPNTPHLEKAELSRLRSRAIDFIKSHLDTNSYIINLEITKGKQGFHPHLHCVIEVPKFIKVSREYVMYMSRLWCSCYTDCDINVINQGYTFYITGITDKAKASQELTKYIFKDSSAEYTSIDVENIADATYNLRKISAGGNLRTLYADGKQNIKTQRDIQRFELIDVDYTDSFFAFLDGEYKKLKI